MSPIKPIPVHDMGCHFRSTLEWRWGRFLTAAGFDWEYEPEGAELESGRYLCDFRVTSPKYHGRSEVDQIWLEVKPKLPQDPPDDPRWLELARSSGLMLFTVRGMHRSGDRCESAHSARAFLPDGTVYEVHRLWQGRQYDKAWDAASGARPDEARGPRRRGRR